MVRLLEIRIRQSLQVPLTLTSIIVEGDVDAYICHISIGCFTTSYGKQCESPKQSGFAIFAQVPFHSLKAAHTVMQSLCSWMHRNVSKGLDHRLAPALPLNMFH